MVPKIFLMTLAILCAIISRSQDSSILKNPARRITFTTQISGDQNVRGYLQSFNDSSIRISKTKVKLFGALSVQNTYEQIAFDNIELVKIRKSGSVGRGILFGALIGIVAGTAIGSISYKKPPPSPGWNFDFGPGLAAAAGGSFGALIGGLAGGIIGSKSRKFLINKNLKNFQNMNAQILNMATKK